MTEKLRIDSKVEEGIIVLTLHYGPELLLNKEVAERLSKELVVRYQEIWETEKKKNQD